MSEIAAHNVSINMSADQAWQKMKDFSIAHMYVPGIDKTTITTEKKEGVGASRRVSGKQQALDETITEWNEGRGFTIRLHNGDKPAFPFKEAQFSYRIDKTTDGSCKLSTTMIYELRWGFLGKLLLNGIIQKQIRDVCLSLKFFYITNKKPSKEDLIKMWASERQMAEPFP